MFLIDPHIHMVSRTTDDYERLALAGVLAVSEPAFWAGFDRSPEGFIDYYRQLTDVEPKRAAQFGIDHYCWICLNPKEAEDLGKAREVLSEIPKFLTKPTILGVGEIGLNKNTPNEAKVFQQHVQLAFDTFSKMPSAAHPARLTTQDSPLKSPPAHHLILIHTPHLEDKHQGTRMILDMLNDFPNLDRNRVLIDHVEEHTISLVKDAGYWCGMTIYPTTKATPARAIDMIEKFGHEKLCINAAADWGISDPMATFKTALEARRRGHTLKTLTDLFHNNPARFFSQSPNFKPKPIEISDEL